MVDITVRGAGIFGLSIAWTCLSRGAMVQIIDPYGAGSGCSGGVVGALAPHVPENWNPKKAFQLESLLMAEDFWKKVGDVGGVNPGYLRSGRIQPILDQPALALARQRAETAKDLWQSHAFWRVEQAHVGDRSPRSPIGWIIRDSLSALLHPRHAIDALVAALEKNGVSIATEGPDRGKVIWATGTAGLEALNQGRQRPVGSGVKGQAALLGLDMAGSPQLFVDGVHIVPHLDGTTAVGSTSEREFDAADTTDTRLDAVIDKATAAIPALKNAPVLQRWAGVRPRARSRAPMLGPWPERPEHYIANGGFKIGFGMAPKVAEVMADLMLEGRDSIPEGFGVAASF